MSNAFLGQITMFGGNFAPRNTALCNGQTLPIAQNQALFSLLGTTYGGNGQTTFALPNLQGRTPIHMGNGHVLGEAGGEQAHTLSISEMPTHTHIANASTANGSTNFANGNILAAAGNLYAAPNSLTTLNPTSITNVGGSQAHQNMQPFLTLTFCIALQGIFPSR